MDNIFKHCTKEDINAFILSLSLLNRDWSSTKIVRCLYAVSSETEKHYQTKKILKKNGKTRTLCIPDSILREIQANLLHNVLENMHISSYATAYHKGADILANVEPHLQKKIILKLDIEDFFSSIDFVKIYSFVFTKELFPQKVRALLTSLCLCGEFLPQGSPTSPTISNIVMRHFDEKIGTWCTNKGISYTRYSDDLTFSGIFDVREVQQKVISYLNYMGFSINQAKTKILYPHVRQSVTGIVLNKKRQVARPYRKDLRQTIYYIQKYGVTAHLKQIKSTMSPEKYLTSLLGKIYYILHINPNDIYFKEKVKEIKLILKQKNYDNLS